jgi:A/G-specific adenine glycosylase
MTPSAADYRAWLAPRLLDWFDVARRDLPWRVDRDPYRIWVSEIMLQQTQVATVVGYFERFMARWPTLAELAQADEQEVLHQWQGLGYYRRARDLLRAARQLAALPDGHFPREPEAFKGLPGWGEYTRNAVLSQAFDVRLPILEANTQRLLSRFFGREDDPREGPARKWLWSAAEAILPEKRVGDFNQALMELGALVCTPRAPRCLVCPIRERCVAYEQGRAEQIPRRNPAPTLTEVKEVSVIIQKNEHVFMAQRPASGRWANLWEFPRVESPDGETLDDAARRAAALVGLHLRSISPLTVLRHGVTRFRITLHGQLAQWEAGEFQPGHYPAARWLTSDQLFSVPVSSPQRRLLAALHTAKDSSSRDGR